MIFFLIKFLIFIKFILKSDVEAFLIFMLLYSTFILKEGSNNNQLNHFTINLVFLDYIYLFSGFNLYN